MRIHSKLVLLLAGNAILLGYILAGDAHVVVVVDIPQSIVNHGIDDGRIAQAVSFARLRQKVRGIGHRLHASRDDDGTVLGLDRLRCESNGFQSRAAYLVDCHGTYLGRQSSVNRSLPRRVLPKPCADHVAHDALIDLLRIDVGALHGLAHYDRSQLRSCEIRQAPLKLSDWSPAPRNDDNIV